MNGTHLGLLLLVVWLLGNVHGAYRYERLWKDRTVRDIWRDWRGGV